MLGGDRVGDRFGHNATWGKSRGDKQSAEASHQAVPLFEQFGHFKVASVTATDATLADGDGSSQVEQCFKDQVVTTILFTQSRVIVDPNMGRHDFVDQSHCSVMCGIGGDDERKGSAGDIIL